MSDNSDPYDAVLLQVEPTSEEVGYYFLRQTPAGRALYDPQGEWLCHLDATPNYSRAPE